MAVPLHPGHTFIFIWSSCFLPNNFPPFLMGDSSLLVWSDVAVSVVEREPQEPDLVALAEPEL
jgi:hypothetical protein